MTCSARWGLRAQNPRWLCLEGECRPRSFHHLGGRGPTARLSLCSPAGPEGKGQPCFASGDSSVRLPKKRGIAPRWG